MSSKKILIAIFVAAFALVTSVGIAVAQNAEVQLQEDFQNAANSDSPNHQQTTNNSTEFTARALLTMVGGCFAESCDENQTAGAIPSMGRMIGMTFHQPADTKTYIADLLQDMNIAQPAYAQGIGFSSLTPLLTIWKLFRNIAYLFFVIIFLIVGFAIMFRQNLGGQAAVTVQQALPRIIVALLMVTFSYAIAGLLIDVMYVVMFFLVAVFSQSSLLNSTLTDFGNEGNILSQNVFEVYKGIITGNFAGNAGEVIGNLVQDMLSGSGSVGDALASGAGWLAGVLGTLIIFFAILFAMFKTFFALAKVYIEIIFMIAFSPIILMMGAIQSNVFGNWVKGLAANLAVFPALLVFVIMGYLLVGGEQAQITRELNEGGFIPPFLPGRGAADSIGLVAGIGAILLLPQVPEIIGRMKPKSMFDDLGAMALKQAKTGELALPIVGAGIGAGYGAARAGAAYTRGARAEGTPVSGRGLFRAIRRGYETEPGVRVGGVLGTKNKPGGAMAGFNYGNKVRGIIDDIQDNRFLEPDNTRKQFERLIQAQENTTKAVDDEKSEDPVGGQ